MVRLSKGDRLINKAIYKNILSSDKSDNLALEQRLIEELRNIGLRGNYDEFVEFIDEAKDNREAIERLLHLGFSEKALFESLSGIVNLEKFSLKKKEE
jgi:hypothetical protein